MDAPPLPVRPPQGSPPPVAQPRGLRLLAGFKIAKSFAVAGIGLGIFTLINRDLDQIIREILHYTRIAPENRYAQLLLEKAGLVSPRTILRAGEGTLLLAAIECAEGFGLWYGRRWAQYLILISSGLFIPEEFLAYVRHPSITHACIIVANIAVLAYVACLRLKPGPSANAPHSQ